MKIDPEKRKIANDLLAFGTLVIGDLIYFSELLNGKVLGCAEDGLLINMMFEHWHDVFHGELVFDTLRAFYPQTGTMGYSDILLGPGVIYSIIRDCGAGQFMALNATLICLHFLGILFLFLSFRKIGFSRRCSLLGILLSFWSCSFSQMTWHLQFFALSFIPMVIYGVLGSWENKDTSFRRRLPYILLCSCATGIMFLSSFYSAYFTCIFVAFTGLLWLIGTGIREKSKMREELKGILRYRKDMMVSFLALLPWLLLLFRIYLPAYRQLGDYSPEMTAALAPLPTDFFRTMSYAPIEAWIRSLLPFQVDDGFQMLAENIWFERSYGWPVMATVLWFGAFLWSVRKKFQEKKSFEMDFYATLTIAFLFLVSCRYGDYCLWTTVISRILPGAGAIRATGRCLGIFLIPMSFCCCRWISDWERGAANKRILIMAELIIFLILTVSAMGKRYMREDTDYYEQIVTNCAVPPEDCEVILLGSLETDAYYTPQTNMIMWMLADYLKLYTINGYTGNYPNGWQMAYIEQNDYIEAVNEWLSYKQISDLTGLYVYVPESNMWLSFNEFQTLFSGQKKTE